MKWLTANKDWCQVPDQFATGFTEDHKRAVDMKGKACAAAAKVDADGKAGAAGSAERRRCGGLLGGGGLTGSYTMPKGAL